MKEPSTYPLDYTQPPTGEVKDHKDPLASTADLVTDYAEKAQDAIKNVRPFLDKSLKEQPMQTLAAMAAVGFVLGAIWKK